MIGNVTAVSKSKSGKAWRVLIEDQTGAQTYYGAAFTSKIDQAQGKRISYTAEDGKFGWWIQDWDFDKANAVVTPPAPHVPGQPVTERPQLRDNRPQNGDRWWLNFVSNCCGQAVAAGTIKDPSEIGPWSRAAYKAITMIQPTWDPKQPGGFDDLEDINF